MCIYRVNPQYVYIYIYPSISTYISKSIQKNGIRTLGQRRKREPAAPLA